MKASWIVIAIGLCGGSAAHAGGLLLPGAGVVSTSRAGAAIASADDAEAITLNPAGIAKSHGTVITLGIDAISYGMTFQRAGSYPAIMEESTSFAGTPFPKMTNAAKPPLGIGSYQPVPLIGIVSDLNGAIPKLHVGFSVYAPNGYPFRDLNNVNGQPYYAKDSSTGAYTFPSAFGNAPPPTRYDIVEQEASIILPSVAVAYSILPNLDIGARFSAGFAQLKSSVAVWGLTNYEENPKQDGIVTINATDDLVTSYGFGLTYRPLPNLELAAQWSAPIDIHGEGNVYPSNGPAVNLNGTAVQITPKPDAMTTCAKGGTPTALKGCVDLEIPMTATIGGRWKFLDPHGKLRGDVELNLGWEHWGAGCDYSNGIANCLDPGDYHVTIDGAVTSPAAPGVSIPLQPQLIEHGLQDTYSVRLGGSWVFPVATDAIVARAGISYDTAAAKPGWERVDFDGAARTMLAFGGSYKLPRVSIDAGFAYIYEGSRTQDRNCMPTSATQGCGPGNTPEAFNQQTGPNPINPAFQFNGQLEDPIDQGTFVSSYVIFMLGASTWF